MINYSYPIETKNYSFNKSRKTLCTIYLHSSFFAIWHIASKINHKYLMGTSKNYLGNLRQFFIGLIRSKSLNVRQHISVFRPNYPEQIFTLSCQDSFWKFPLNIINYSYPICLLKRLTNLL